MLLIVAGLFTTMFFPTLYLAQVKGYSPIKVGLAILSSIAAARTASLLHHGGAAATATATAQQDALVQGFQRDSSSAGSASPSASSSPCLGSREPSVPARPATLGPRR